ncbi:hypothetical protein FS749_001282 [Ceratobasidium sp. UAMH 11750]|nr:hypothetical protein FS749_001282 [Ceratobasidium sp. UAMH 11750]
MCVGNRVGVVMFGGRRPCPLGTRIGLGFVTGRSVLKGKPGTRAAGSYQCHYSLGVFYPWALEFRSGQDAVPSPRNMLVDNIWARLSSGPVLLMPNAPNLCAPQPSSSTQL